MNIYKIKTGEARDIGFYIKDVNTKEPINVDGYTFTMTIKVAPTDDSAIFSIQSSAFNLALASVGKVSAFITSAMSNINAMDYHGEIQCVNANSSPSYIYKTDTFIFKVEQAVK